MFSKDEWRSEDDQPKKMGRKNRPLDAF